MTTHRSLCSRSKIPLHGDGCPCRSLSPAARMKIVLALIREASTPPSCSLGSMDTHGNAETDCLCPTSARRTNSGA